MTDVQTLVNSIRLHTCCRDLATSVAGDGTSAWFPAAARGTVSCPRSGRPSECRRASAGARPFRRRSSRGRLDRIADSAPVSCPEDALSDLYLYTVRRTMDFHAAKPASDAE